MTFAISSPSTLFRVDCVDERTDGLNYVLKVGRVMETDSTELFGPLAGLYKPRGTIQPA